MNNLDPNIFKEVTVEQVADIYYGGRVFNRAVWCKDGGKRILGIVLPTDDEVTEYKFETQSSEHVHILMGECYVKIGDEQTPNYYRAGHGFFVEGHSHYVMTNEDVVQYVCKFEG